MDIALFISGAAWAGYIFAAFLPRFFSPSRPWDNWFLTAFISLSFWISSGWFLYGKPAPQGIILWYIIGSLGLAVFLSANYLFILKYIGKRIGKLRRALIFLPPLVAGFIPFVFGKPDTSAHGYPFSRTFQSLQFIVLILYTLFPIFILLCKGKKSSIPREDKTSLYMSLGLILIPVLFLLGPLFSKRFGLPDLAFFFSLPYALSVIIGSARYRTLFLLPLRLSSSLLEALGAPALLTDPRLQISGKNQAFSEIFGETSGITLTETSGEEVSGLAERVIRDKLSSADLIWTAPGAGETGAFRVTISPILSGEKTAALAGLLIVFRPMDNIKRVTERYSLSPKESEVALLLTKGYSAKQVAEALNVSETTVRTHRNHIYEKCGLKTRAELATLFTL